MKKTLLLILVMTMILGISIPAMASRGSGTFYFGGKPYIPDESTEEYSSGQYKVGKDIPAGEYVVFARGGSGYFCISSDSNGDNIIQNNNFENNSIITITNKQYLELVRCYAVPIMDAISIDLSEDGMFKVGLHLSAGEYKLIANHDEMGYYCIYSSSTQKTIVSNNNFEGSQYVTVKNGQYLELVRCTFDEIPQVLISNKEIIKEVQKNLNAKGYKCGTPDGIAGAKTDAAIIKYKQDNDMEPTSDITPELVEALR